MKVKRIVLGVVILILIAGAIYGVMDYRGRQKHPLTLYGNVDIRTVNLGFRVGGRLARLMVDEGDSIRPGQVLAQLDDAPNRNALQQAQANADSARAKLDLMLAGYRSEEIAQVRSQLDQLQAAYDYAQRFFLRQQGARAKQAISADALDDALAARNQAKANLQAASDKLRQYQTGNRQQDIASARADLAQAQAALAQAELDVTDTVLTSPSSGTLLTRAQEAGSMLSAGQTVFTLSLTRPVWVRAYIAERYLTQAVPGSEVDVSTDEQGGKIYHGKIGFVSPTAEFTPKSVETPELRTDLVYRLRIIVTDADDRLRQGMPVTLRFPSVDGSTHDR